MPAFKLQYFDVRGIAETARMLFAVGAVEYEDARFEISVDLKPDGTPDFSTLKREAFDAAKAEGALKMSGDKLPLLYVDGVPAFGQSKAIERYVARVAGLAGDDELQIAKGDAIAETVRDMKDAYQKAKGDPESKAKFFAETMPSAMKALEATLPDSDGEFLMGDKILYPDIALYNFAAGPKGFFDDAESAAASFKECPKITKAMAACGTHEALQKYIGTRKDTML